MKLKYKYHGRDKKKAQGGGLQPPTSPNPLHSLIFERKEGKEEEKRGGGRKPPSKC